MPEDERKSVGGVVQAFLWPWLATLALTAVLLAGVMVVAVARLDVTDSTFSTAAAGLVGWIAILGVLVLPPWHFLTGLLHPAFEDRRGLGALVGVVSAVLAFLCCVLLCALRVG